MNKKTQEALEKLQQGNRRFLEKSPSEQAIRHHDEKLAAAQTPFAVILSCADSRVPPEIIFDQGMGDLFVIRVAGNLAKKTQLGSIELAVTQFGATLIVVLSHSNCGAVEAALKDLQQPLKNIPSNLRAIIDDIRPAIKDTPSNCDPSKHLDHAIQDNVRNTIHEISKQSEILDQMLKSDRIAIVGAEYYLETGEVEFLEEE